MAETLEQLPNIGKTTAAALRQAGIETPGQLRQVGSREAWLRLKTQDPGACLHLLSGLEGAVQGVRKQDLAAADKAALKEFFDSVK